MSRMFAVARVPSVLFLNSANRLAIFVSQPGSESTSVVFRNSYGYAAIAEMEVLYARTPISSSVNSRTLRTFWSWWMNFSFGGWGGADRMQANLILSLTQSGAGGVGTASSFSDVDCRRSLGGSR